MGTIVADALELVSYKNSIIFQFCNWYCTCQAGNGNNCSEKILSSLLKDGPATQYYRICKIYNFKFYKKPYS